MFENRFNPLKWNIYLFYFTDGENWTSDNEVFINTLKEDFNINVVNMVGITQVLSWNYEGSLKQVVDKHDFKNLKTTQVSYDQDQYTSITEEDRDKQIKEAITDLLGKEKSNGG